MPFFGISYTLDVKMMKKNSRLSANAKLIRDIILGSGFATIASLFANKFIRNRTLPLPLLCIMILRNIRQALQLEIDYIFELIGQEVQTVSKQAFSKARTFLDPLAIKYIAFAVTRNMCKAKDLEYYNARYKLCSFDGSDIALYNSDELRCEYGVSGGSEKAATALASFAYDPLNNMILDASLNHVDTDERDCAKQHIENIHKLPLKFRKKYLFIMDRGYPSRDFLAWLLNGKHKFIMRVRRKFNLEFDSVERDEWLSFNWERKTYRVRIIKVTLDSGEIETLITNLDGCELQYENAGDLYFKRWPIETKFNSLKNKLELENMSGRRIVTVQQDFWASVFLANMLTSAEWQTDTAIENNTIDSGNKYEQTTNEYRLISKFRKMFIQCLLEPSDSKREILFDKLIADVARRPEDIKPNRSYPRRTPRKARFHDTYKSVT